MCFTRTHREKGIEEDLKTWSRDNETELPNMGMTWGELQGEQKVEQLGLSLLKVYATMGKKDR